ncbi:uncharacterized protein B0I36DRAFT_63859 [Microdochium trichocladiopsis]|uniref:Uncharacterized protein n=1 Tax=Microdochium trichocladiopsis TaxID=1682393 RepID=A0A9P9BU62_9PEZI|nr:uncharacterized protein B0I36DRAFT_63859 [Microdochium trichocladiopsis]KAH7037286.1 hypothetical protein B0I36DRAFT_63859 [Microdochium trichocladiopsis]
MDRRGRGRGGGVPYGRSPPRTLPHAPIRTTEGICGTQPPRAEDSEAATTASASEPQGTPPRSFDASLDDVKQVKMLLTSKGLPWEIVNIIMDRAEYWACSKSSIDYRQLGMRYLGIAGGDPEREDRFLLRCDPVGLTKWTPPARDSPGHEMWSTAAEPRVVTETDESLIMSPGSGQHDGIDTAALSPNAGTKPPTPTAASTTDHLEFGKETLEEFTDVPVPTLENPVRKLVFDIFSCDQGFGGNDPGIRPDAPYDGSHTWFDVGIDRFDKAINCAKDCEEQENTDPSDTSTSTEPHAELRTCMIRSVWPLSRSSDTTKSTVTDGNSSRRTANVPGGSKKLYHALHPDYKHVIHFNKRVEREVQHHHVEWSWLDGSVTEHVDIGYLGRVPNGNGDFVRGLRLGDMVTIWGRARYLGWRNKVTSVDVRIYYAV